MKVLVGSKNPSKVTAVKRAFKTYFPDEDIDYLAVDADSGVREQPLSTEETIEGAINRALNVVQVEADFSVGLEGGINFYTVKEREYAEEIGWVCVCNCKTGQHEIANSAGYSLFPRVIKHIHKGHNLSDAMLKEYNLQNLGQKNGYIGWLSKDVLTRESSQADAVLLALSSLLKEEGK